MPNKTYHVSIITAKIRVTPNTHLSVPRLELQAVVLATRIARMIKNEHDIQIVKRTFWSDSITVLHWINKDSDKFKVFVANRLGEICENSKPSEWRWVPTHLNHVDEGTRYAPDALSDKSRWFLGP